MKLPKIFNNFMKVGLANYISRAISAFISILLAMWLGPSEFGIFSIGSYTMVISGMSLAGFDQSYVHFSVRDKKKEDEIFTTYCSLKMLISFSFIFLASLFLLSILPDIIRIYLFYIQLFQVV